MVEYDSSGSGFLKTTLVAGALALLSACATSPEKLAGGYTPVRAETGLDIDYKRGRITVPEQFRRTQREFVDAYLNPEVIKNLEETMGAEGYTGDGIVIARWNQGVDGFLEALLNGRQYLDNNLMQVPSVVYMNGDRARKEMGPDASYVVVGGFKNRNRKGEAIESEPQVYGLFFGKSDLAPGVDNLVFDKAVNAGKIAKEFPEYQGVEHPTDMFLRFEGNDLKELMALVSSENRIMSEQVLPKIPEGKWYNLGEDDVRGLLATKLFSKVGAIMDRTSFGSVVKAGYFVQRRNDGLMPRIIHVDDKGKKQTYEVKPHVSELKDTLEFDAEVKEQDDDTSVKQTAEDFLWEESKPQ